MLGIYIGVVANNSAAHSKLKNEILLALGRRKDVLIWNNPIGMFIPYNRPDSPPVRIGKEGQADVLASVAPLGRLVGIECKTGKGTQSQEQKDWQIALEKRGGIYGVVRSVEDALSLVDEATDIKKALILIQNHRI